MRLARTGLDHLKEEMSLGVYILVCWLDSQAFSFMSYLASQSLRSDVNFLSTQIASFAGCPALAYTAPSGVREPRFIKGPNVIIMVFMP